jgi:hypothetical protein
MSQGVQLIKRLSCSYPGAHVQPDSDPVVLSSRTAQRSVGREQAKWEKAKRDSAQVGRAS